MATLSVDGKYAAGSNSPAAPGSTYPIPAPNAEADSLAPHEQNPNPNAGASASGASGARGARGANVTGATNAGTPANPPAASGEVDTAGMPRHLAYVMESLGEDFTDGAGAGIATTYRSGGSGGSGAAGSIRTGGTGLRRGGHARTSGEGDFPYPDADLGFSVDPAFGDTGDIPVGRSVGFSPRASLGAGATGGGRGNPANNFLGNALANTFGVFPGAGGAGGAPRGGITSSLNTNVMALQAYRNMANAHKILNDSLLKLTSGERINNPGDDAAGLALAENMRSQLLGSKQAVRNAQDGISLVQTAEGVLGTVHNMLQRMRVLAVQGASDSNQDQRGNIVTEMDSIRVEIGRIGEATEVLGRKILGDKYVEPADALRFQIGANGTDLDTIAVTFVDVVDIAHAQLGEIPQDASHEAFQGAIVNIDGQIEVISTARATLGAVMSRFENTINTLNVTVENLAAARGRIQDTDFTTESAEYMRGRILTQSSHAVMSQALLAPRGVLSLLSVA